jgi:hypothetical protein
VIHRPEPRCRDENETLHVDDPFLIREEHRVLEATVPRHERLAALGRSGVLPALLQHEALDFRLRSMCSLSSAALLICATRYASWSATSDGYGGGRCSVDTYRDTSARTVNHGNREAKISAVRTLSGGVVPVARALARQHRSFSWVGDDSLTLDADDIVEVDDRPARSGRRGPCSP